MGSKTVFGILTAMGVLAYSLGCAATHRADRASQWPARPEGLLLPEPESTSGDEGGVTLTFGFLERHSQWATPCEAREGEEISAGAPVSQRAAWPEWVTGDWPDPRHDPPPELSKGPESSFIRAELERVLRCLGEQESPDSLPVLRLTVPTGEKGRLEMSTHTDYVSGHARGTEGELVPQIATASDGIRIAATPTIIPGTSDVEVECRMRVGRTGFRKPLYEERVSYQATDAGEKVRVPIERPVESYRLLQTTVRVPSGRTSLLGAVRFRESARGRMGISLLRRIPLVGPIFGRQKVHHEAHASWQLMHASVGVAAESDATGQRVDPAVLVLVRVRRLEAVMPRDESVRTELWEPYRARGQGVSIRELPLWHYVLPSSDEVRRLEAALRQKADVVSEVDVVLVGLDGKRFEFRDLTDTVCVSRPNESGPPGDYETYVETLSYGITFSGTPHVNEDGSIELDVEAEYSWDDIDKYTVQDTVTARDGMTEHVCERAIELPERMSVRFNERFRVNAGETIWVPELRYVRRPEGRLVRQPLILLSAEVLPEP